MNPSLAVFFTQLRLALTLLMQQRMPLLPYLLRAGITGMCYLAGLCISGVYHVSLTPAPSSIYRLKVSCVGKSHYKLFPSGINNRKAGLNLPLCKWQ